MVDDHAGFRRSTRRLLERHRYRVVEAADGASAVRELAAVRPDLVLLDVHLPDADGFEVASRIREADPMATIVLISTHPIADVADRLAGSAANGFIDKAELSASTIAAMLTRRM